MGILDPLRHKLNRFSPREFPHAVSMGSEAYRAVQLIYELEKMIPGEGQPYFFKGLPVTLDTDLPVFEARWHVGVGSSLRSALQGVE